MFFVGFIAPFPSEWRVVKGNMFLCVESDVLHICKSAVMPAGMVLLLRVSEAYSAVNESLWFGGIGESVQPNRIVIIN